MIPFLRRIRADVVLVLAVAAIAVTHPAFVLDLLDLVFGWRGKR